MPGGLPGGVTPVPIGGVVVGGPGYPVPGGFEPVGPGPVPEPGPETVGPVVVSFAHAEVEATKVAATARSKEACMLATV